VSEFHDALASNAMAGPKAGDLVKRHRLSTRLWHWTNAFTLLVMLMSGLAIFNAYPRLHWGKYGSEHDSAWLEISSRNDRGYVRVGDTQFDTTGLLGQWNWHLAFAWVLSLSLTFYMLWSLLNGHVRRDLHIRRPEWSPAHIWHDIKEHARLRFPTGVEALNYNILQKLSYIGVIFVLIPMMIATGLSMSPDMNAGMTWLVELLGGRQSARSIHFLCAFALVAFFFVHMAMVVLAGPFNEVRSMITGKYRLPGKAAVPDAMVETAQEIAA
jgi:thiosulfate reductase cytochrome b subunit